MLQESWTSFQAIQNFNIKQKEDDIPQQYALIFLDCTLQSINGHLCKSSVCKYIYFLDLVGPLTTFDFH